MPQQTTLRELQVQVLPQAFGAALQKLAIMQHQLAKPTVIAKMNQDGVARARRSGTERAPYIVAG